MQGYSSDRFLVIGQIIKQKQQNNHNNFGKKYWLKPPWQGFKSNCTDGLVWQRHVQNKTKQSSRVVSFEISKK
jgi:hypothetical protein